MSRFSSFVNRGPIWKGKVAITIVYAKYNVIKHTVTLVPRFLCLPKYKNIDRNSFICIFSKFLSLFIWSIYIFICIFLCEILSFLLQLDAIRLAGVTKKIYTSFRHTVEKLLGIGKCITIKDLCLQFGVSEAMPLAQKLLEK